MTSVAQKAALSPYMVPSTPKFRYIDDVELDGSPIDPFEMDEECLYEEIMECGVPILEVGVCVARGRGHGSPLPLVMRMAILASCDKPSAAIPTEIGSHPIPLHFNVCLAGGSGLGKGLTTSAPLVTLDPLGGFIKVQPGSGELLVAKFFHLVDAPDGKGKELEQHGIPVIAEWAEIDAMVAKSDSKNSTLDTTLRSIWTGEDAGDESISRMKAGIGSRIEAGTYTCSMLVGAQMDHAGKLLEDQTGGSLQRLIWMPLIDADAPKRSEARAYRDRLAALMGSPAGAYETRTPTVAIWGPSGDITVADEILDILWDDRQSILSGETRIDALDTHLNNNRVRLAAVFAGWRAGPGGKVHIDREAWYWAGCVLSISQKTRAACEAAWDAKKHGVSVDAGRTAADFQLAKDRRLEELKGERKGKLKKRLVLAAAEIPGMDMWKGAKRTDPSKPAMRGELFRHTTNSDREIFDTVIKDLVAEDALTPTQINRVNYYPLGPNADQYLY